MRTKILCAAALAAGALTTMAQVYSANIVGYVNVPVGQGYTFLANPLDASPDNGANNVMPNPDPTQDYSGPYDNSTIQEWTGTGWTISLFDSVTTDTTTGFMDNSATTVVPAPVLSSGKGFLFNNQGTATSVTFVGQVRTGTNTTVFPQRNVPYAVGSMLPVSGGVSTSLGFSNPDPTQDYSGPLDNDVVELLKVNASGQAAGYDVYLFDSVTTDTTTGFMDNSASVVRPEPQIPMAGGFFFANNNGVGTYNWSQILNP